MHKVYCGRRIPRDPASAVVWVNGKVLTPERSLKVENKSPTGFNWGYGGSGPAQLALALLLDALSSTRAAAQWFQLFKRQVVASLPEQWVLTASDIRNWYQNVRAETLDEDGKEMLNASESQN
jgi:hypothetical protein